jgi:hypothetical protein
MLEHTLICHADVAASFVCEDGEVYLTSKQRVRRAVVNRSTFLKDMAQLARAHGDRKDVVMPFSRSDLEAWVRGAGSGSVTQSHRWQDMVTSMQARLDFVLGCHTQPARACLLFSISIVSCGKLCCALVSLMASQGCFR